MKRVLVAGAGYIGGKVIELFRKNGWEAIGLSLQGNDGLLSCDLGSPQEVNTLPEVDVVVHCAASGRGGADAYRRVYFDGAKNLMARYPGKSLLFTSSSSVYPQVDGEVVTEESAATPERETGRILLAAEAEIVSAGGIVARLAGIYGPGRSSFFRKFIAEDAQLEASGARVMNQIHQEDAANAIYFLLGLGRGQGGEIYNVCDSSPLSQVEIYQGLIDRFGGSMPPSVPRDLNRKRGWTNKRVSNQKIRDLGWVPKYKSFLEGVESLTKAGF